MLPVNFLCSLSMLIIVGDHNTGAAATRTKTQQCATVTFQLSSVGAMHGLQWWLALHGFAMVVA